MGSSDVEVRYRDVEMARIRNSHRVNRIHRARDDSGHNEAERFNACNHDALVGLTLDEIESLSLDDVKRRDKLAIEQNAWTVADNVAEGINHERGPAGGYMQSFHCDSKQFFFSTQNNYASLCRPHIPSRNTSRGLHILRN